MPGQVPAEIPSHLSSWLQHPEPLLCRAHSAAHLSAAAPQGEPKHLQTIGGVPRRAGAGVGGSGAEKPAQASDKLVLSQLLHSQYHVLHNLSAVPYLGKCELDHV